jgi:hypothetical protein
MNLAKTALQSARPPQKKQAAREVGKQSFGTGSCDRKKN